MDNEKIKMEVRKGNNYSYYVDANGILKGKWGGYRKSFCTIKGQHMMGIYYTRFNIIIPITDTGLFYGKFSCKKYDGILKLPYCEKYICEVNDKLGLIDENGITILSLSYLNVKPFFWGVRQGYRQQHFYLLGNNVSDYWQPDYLNSIFLINTCEKGKVLYSLSNNKFSKVYDDIFINCNNPDNHSHIIYRINEKYGALDIDGHEILKPYYEYSDIHQYLYYHYQGLDFPIWVENGLIYRAIPADDYDVCFVVGEDTHMRFGHYYIVKNGNKYGILSYDKSIISETNLDEIILYNPSYRCFDNGCLRINGWKVNITYVIARIGNKYKLYH